MKSNKAFLFKIFFFAVGNSVVELGAWMALRCVLRRIRKRAAPMAVEFLRK